MITIDRKSLAAANIQIIDLSYAAGETIYERGALAQFVYAVEEGALFRFTELPGCRRSIQQFLFASDGFGYEIGRHHRDTVQALTDTKVLAAGREALLRAAASNALLSNLLFSAAASAVLVAEKNAEIRCVGTVTEKIAQFLLEMEVRLSKRGEIDLPMRRHHIADYFGLTLETVSRTFSTLHNKKIIQFRDQRQRRIVICDKRRLRELASDASIFEESSVLKTRKAMNTPEMPPGQWAVGRT